MINKNQKGFSLVELLVVVIIIGIIAAIAIPSLLASRRAANEASAISTLRTIHSANVTYYATNNSAYTTLALLSTGGLLDPTFAGAQPITKSGYSIAESIVSGGGGYCASANPVTPGGSGTRIFGVSDTGVIYQGVAAGACATGVLTTTGGTPIQ